MNNKPPFIKLIDSGIDFILSCKHKPNTGKTVHLLDDNENWNLATMDDLMNVDEKHINTMIVGYDRDNMDIAIFLAKYNVLGILKAHKKKGVVSPVALLETNSCIISPSPGISEMFDKIKKTGSGGYQKAEEHDAALNDLINQQEFSRNEDALDLTKEVTVDKPAVYDGSPIDI